MRGVVMLPVSVHWPVDGLYSSALARKPSVFSPPAMSTCPLGSSVAVWPALARVQATRQRPGSGCLRNSGRGGNCEKTHCNYHRESGCRNRSGPFSARRNHVTLLVSGETEALLLPACSHRTGKRFPQVVNSP